MDAKYDMASELSQVALALLVKYGGHTDDCSPRNCTCGWEARGFSSGWSDAIKYEFERREEQKS